MPQPDTKQRILDAAEEHFAAHGFAETTLRGLTSAAGVNLAAVHYHFGSKERLFLEVLSRIVAPVNEERLRLFAALEAAGEPTVEALLEAFLAPAIEFTAGEPERAANLRRLVSRLQLSPDALRGESMELFREVVQRFTELCGRALPHLDETTLCWRLHFLVGSLVFTFHDPAGLERVSRGVCRADDPGAFLDQMVAAFAGAFRASAPAADANPSRTESA